MRNRLRRPLTWVWGGAVCFAMLLGLLIGGSPVTPKDVPLRDRKVVPTTAPSATVPTGSAPTSTTVVR